ncbi:hypothetical protein NDU88_007660 [Pleurodeles waltl]|uniref:Uncharacterized protein n=1 Tax=Pleurodeles waltl TaxID=8319 RepID=A0AAV7N2U1_PLEWA|nr:hypothetical protein NDU88_007660 [Pleurodeles waltl]
METLEDSTLERPTTTPAEGHKTQEAIVAPPKNTRAHTHWTQTRKARPIEKVERQTKGPEDNNKATRPQPKPEDSGRKYRLHQTDTGKGNMTPTSGQRGGTSAQGETNGAQKGTATQSSSDIPHPLKSQRQMITNVQNTTSRAIKARAPNQQTCQPAEQTVKPEEKG